MEQKKTFHLAILDFAYFPTYDKSIEFLANNLADKEEWEFTDAKRPKYSILKNYIEHIFRKVGLWDWISTLPQGIDTRLAEAGNSISGGQKQRIGIARALYKGASVLFFDEATSSVDMKAESEINRFVTELSHEDESLTVIVIAHRQETLASCARIIDIDSVR